MAPGRAGSWHETAVAPREPGPDTSTPPSLEAAALAQARELNPQGPPNRPPPQGNVVTSKNTPSAHPKR